MPREPLNPWLSPCPCGSGDRFGQCCGRLEADMPPAWAEAHRLWLVGRQLLGGYLRQRYPRSLIEAAYARFTRPPEPGCFEEASWTAFIDSFILYDWVPPGEEQTVVDEWLERAGANPHPAGVPVLELIRATRANPLSFYQVERIVPSQGIEIRDLFRDRTTFVHDRSLSFTSERWKILCARLLPWSGVTILDALGPTVLGPTWRSRLWQALDEMGLEPPLEDRELGELGREILEVYDDAVSAELEAARQPQILNNTDGHPMVFCERTYRFARADLGIVLDRLLDLGFQSATADAIADPDQDLDVVDDIKLSLVDADRELLPGAGPVNVADVTFPRAEPGTFVLATNSRERQERFATMIEAELSPLIEQGPLDERPMNRIERWTPEAGWIDPRASLGQEEGPEEDPLAELSPEFRAALDVELTRMIEKASLAWPDQQIPALGGLTPRQAVRTKEGRLAVEDLLRSFPSPPPDQRNARAGMDLDLIYRELGLPIPK